MNEYQVLKQFDEYLDEVHPPVRFGTWEFRPSEVLKNADPIGYRTMFNDWLDSEGIELDD